MKKINGYTKEEAVKLAFKLGFENEKNKKSCSQSSLNAIASVLGIKNPMLFKCVEALEGGGASTHVNSCGAFSAPLAIFSYFFGRDYEMFETGEKDEKADEIGKKLYAKFYDRWNSALCNEIQQKVFGFEVDSLTENEKEELEESDIYLNGCPTVVGLAAAWTIEIIWDELKADTDLTGIPDMEDIASFFPPIKYGIKRNDSSLVGVS